MTRKTLTAGLGLLAVGLWLGGAPQCLAAPVVPVKQITAAPAGPSMADLLTGKLYPNTVKRSDLMANYHLVSLIDAQGKPAVCATQGALLTLGGETFLVAYLLPPPPATTPGAGTATPAPATPPADADAQLTLINMRYVQALGGIRDVPPPTEAPAPPAAPPTAPAGTATP